MDIFLFALLAWYFDHVDNSNRGKTYSKLFFLEKSYWFGSPEGSRAKSSDVALSTNVLDIERLSKSLQNHEQRLLPDSRNKSSFNNSKSCNITSINESIAEDDSIDEASEMGLKSVLEEKLKLLNAIQDGKDFEGLRILGVKKTFKIANKCCGTKDVHALKSVNIYYNIFFRHI